MDDYICDDRLNVDKLGEEISKMTEEEKKEFLKKIDSGEETLERFYY